MYKRNGKTKLRGYLVSGENVKKGGGGGHSVNVYFLLFAKK